MASLARAFSRTRFGFRVMTELMGRVRDIHASGTTVVLVDQSLSTALALGLLVPDRGRAQVVVAPDKAYQEAVGNLERFIEHEVKEKELPALSVALVDGPRIVWARISFGQFHHRLWRCIRPRCMAGSRTAVLERKRSAFLDKGQA